MFGQTGTPQKGVYPQAEAYTIFRGPCTWPPFGVEKKCKCEKQVMPIFEHF